MNNKAYIIGGLAVGLITGLSLTLGAVSYASEEENTPAPRMRHFNNEEVQEALENKDFELWKDLLTKNNQEPKILEVIDEDNFDEFVEMHELMKEGNEEEAEKIREELGLPEMRVPGKGKRGRGNPEHRQEAIEALENEDFDEWKEAISQDGREPKVLETINEENFDKFVEMHKLMQDGETEEAEAIRAELGLPEKKAREAGRCQGAQGEKGARPNRMKQNQSQDNQ